MEGRSKEDTRKSSSPPCQNPTSPNCNFCGRTKRKISHAYGRSISFPPSSSPAHHRPSPPLFRSMSDVSPLPSPFPALWNQIPTTPTTSPPVPTSPAPVPPAVKISPEMKTISCNNADVSLACPASETVSTSLDPNPDSDPATEEVIAKLLRLGEQQLELNKELERSKIETNVLRGALTENNNNNNTASQELQRLREQQVELKKEMERFAETPKGKIVLGGALTENNNDNNNTASNNNNNTNTLSQELQRLREQQVELELQRLREQQVELELQRLREQQVELELLQRLREQQVELELQRLREQQVELKKEMERFAETPKGEIVLGGALTENNNDNNNTASNNNNNTNTLSQVHEELTTGSGGGKLAISFTCSCRKTITIGSSGEELEFSFVCTCGRSHNVVFT